MRKFLSAIRSGFGFLTTIPVGITMEGIENLM
ncbi:MAG: adenosylcobinamide-GDP ribazoletransferase, partial [Candidatus Methanoperedens sp.]|nr:adenosylcobinamide-GDP ribazoletransferase [Candidatus Methanoperedens sp.]